MPRVQRAMTGEFGSAENIARAKGELVESLAPEGAAVLNADDAQVSAMTSRTVANVAGDTSPTPILMHSQTLLQSRHVTHQTTRTVRGEDAGTAAEAYTTPPLA